MSLARRKPCCGGGMCPACDCCICVCTKKLSPKARAQLKKTLGI